MAFCGCLSYNRDMEKSISSPAAISADTPLGEIVFEFERRAVRNVNLRVRSDGSIRVSAPARTSLAYVKKFVADHAEWIVKKRDESLARTRERELGFVERGALHLAGRELAVVYEEGRAGRVSADGKRVLVTAPTVQAADAALARWLERRAKEMLPAVFGRAEAAWGEGGGEPVALSLRNMRSRWGSCNAKKRRVTLNTVLVTAPEECVEYVCMHELAHFRSMRHDRAFYEELDRLCPDRKRLRAELTAVSSRYLRAGARKK